MRKLRDYNFIKTKLYQAMKNKLLTISLCLLLACGCAKKQDETLVPSLGIAVSNNEEMQKLNDNFYQFLSIEDLKNFDPQFARLKQNVTNIINSTNKDHQNKIYTDYWSILFNGCKALETRFMQKTTSVIPKQKIQECFNTLVVYISRLEYLVNMQDSSGKTFMHMAVNMQNVDAVVILLNHSRINPQPCHERWYYTLTHCHAASVNY